MRNADAGKCFCHLVVNAKLIKVKMFNVVKRVCVGQYSKSEIRDGRSMCRFGLATAIRPRGVARLINKVNKLIALCTPSGEFVIELK